METGGGITDGTLATTCIRFEGYSLQTSLGLSWKRCALGGQGLRIFFSCKAEGCVPGTDPKRGRRCVCVWGDGGKITRADD